MSTALDPGEPPAPQPARAAPALPSPPLPYPVILAYAAPWAAYMAVSMPISTWFGKHSTDVLFVPAAAVGVVVMVARLWDAISDPVAGYLSDRTRSRWGRRGSWMRASALPIAVTLYALWAPPASLGPTATLLWVAAAYLLWETASTAFLVPYGALGNELTGEYHQRTRLFAWRHGLSLAGYGLSLAVIGWLSGAAERGIDEARATAATAGLVCGIGLAVVVWLAARKLPEPEAHQGRGALGVRAAFGSVARNPHARILLVAFAIEAFGMGSLGFMAPYVVDDVLGNPGLLVPVLATWMIPQFLFTPLWLWTSRHVGKKRLLLVGMVVASGAFFANAFLAPGREWVMFAAVLVLGIGGGIISVLAPSIQADVIDYDELLTGERKEGAYTAIWNLLRKAGWGVAAGIGGVALGAAGYDGELAQQSAAVHQTLIVFVSFVPAAGYLLGALYFTRFALNEDEHAQLRGELLRRRSGGTAP